MANHTVNATNKRAAAVIAHLNEFERNALDKIARKQGLSRSNVVRVIIRQSLG